MGSAGSLTTPDQTLEQIDATTVLVVAIGNLRSLAISFQTATILICIVSVIMQAMATKPVASPMELATEQVLAGDFKN